MEQKNEFIEKKYFVLTILLLTTIMLILFISSYLLSNKRIKSIEGGAYENVITVFKEESEEASSNDKYIIKDFNGKIGVYKNNDIQYTIDVYIFTLPEKDKNLLSQGIEVSSEQEIEKILSCYY